MGLDSLFALLVGLNSRVDVFMGLAVLIYVWVFDVYMGVVAVLIYL